MPYSGYPFAAKVGQFKPPNWTNLEYRNHGALKGVEALILAVRHKPYLHLKPDEVVKWAGGPIAVVDCFGILEDTDITNYFELGSEVKALGRGHIQRIKEKVRSSRA